MTWVLGYLLIAIMHAINSRLHDRKNVITRLQTNNIPVDELLLFYFFVGLAWPSELYLSVKKLYKRGIINNG